MVNTVTQIKTNPLTQLYRKLVKPKWIMLDGMRVVTDPAVVTKGIRKGLYRGNYEFGERALARMALKPTDRVLEIGAGVGVVSLVCSSICGEKSVLSYEINPLAVQGLRANFKLNHMNPNIRQRAIAAEKGQHSFYFNKNIFSSSLLARNNTREELVECDALGDVLAEFQPNVLVMDVEGAEETLLPLIKQSPIKSIIVEMHPHIIGQEAVNHLIEGLGAAHFVLFASDGANVYWFGRD